MKSLRTAIIALFCILFSVSAASAQESDEIVAELKAPLGLSDEQAQQMSALMTKYKGQMDKTLAKHEDAEEPDVEAMIADVRGVRDGYRKELSKILSKEQNQAYLNKVEEVIEEMFSDIAEIRLIDMQPKLTLSDEQVEKLAPVLGKSMREIVRIAFENAGTRLGIRKKIKIGKTLKRLQRDTRTAVEGILTPEQLKAFDAYREEQKAKNSK